MRSNSEIGKLGKFFFFLGDFLLCQGVEFYKMFVRADLKDLQVQSS